MLDRIGKDLGILLLRVFIGFYMIFAHGWGKMMNFPKLMNSFPDPIGIGTTLSLTGAVFTEVVCSLMIILGIKTRWFSGPALFTMLVAAFVIHANDPWMKKEKALLYAISYLALMITGGGKYSVRD
jgi:putative oxidoreductase